MLCGTRVDSDSNQFVDEWVVIEVHHLNQVTVPFFWDCFLEVSFQTVGSEVQDGWEVKLAVDLLTLKRVIV